MAAAAEKKALVVYVCMFHQAFFSILFIIFFLFFLLVRHVEPKE